MKKQTKKTLSIILGMLLIVTIVSAGIFDVISTLNKTIELDKAERDYLINTLPTSFDSKGDIIPKEIKPVVNIDCNENDCKYSVVQEGIISSYDNIINRKYCSEYNVTINECIEYATYTINEIETQVTENINQRLKDYVNVSIERDNNIYEKASEGTVEVIEKPMVIIK